MKQQTIAGLSTLAIVLLIFLDSCNSPGNGPGTEPPDDTQYAAADAFPNLQFTQPVDLTFADDGTNRLFVVEQAGNIRVFNNAADVSSSTLFLNITGRVTAGGERGLLGIAFHPDFRNNGYFYVNYTRGNPLETAISRFKATGNQADPASEQVLLTFSQPQTNHNGGGLFFGKDGFLYIATGDGGGGGDPQNYAQSLNTLLGKILRIDVNSTEKGNYGIPSDNPFKGGTQGAREEIFAYGLRNPWRISQDPETGEIWTADVGQNALEEIDIIVKGGNYGWRKKEGTACYNPQNNCDESSFIAPVWEYGRQAGDVSITGGFVYRGKNLPGLTGHYVYGDYASGRIWALSKSSGQAAVNRLLIENGGRISSFGVDASRELYYCQYNTGKIRKLAIR